MRHTREFTTAVEERSGAFPTAFKLNPPAPKPAKRHLDLAERRAIYSAVVMRGSSPEALAAAFRVSLGTVLRIVNHCVSEDFEGSLTIRPTTDRGDAR